MIAEMRNEIGEKLVVTLAALWMILHGERERIITEPHLFDDVIRCAPGFDFEAVAEFSERLMMRAVDLVEPVRRGTIRPQRLNVVLLHFRRVVPGNVEMEGAPERDVK